MHTQDTPQQEDDAQAIAAFLCVAGMPGMMHPVFSPQTQSLLEIQAVLQARKQNENDVSQGAVEVKSVIPTVR